MMGRCDRLVLVQLLLLVLCPNCDGVSLSKAPTMANFIEISSRLEELEMANSQLKAKLEDTSSVDKALAKLKVDSTVFDQLEKIADSEKDVEQVKSRLVATSKSIAGAEGKPKVSVKMGNSKTTVKFGGDEGASESVAPLPQVPAVDAIDTVRTISWAP